MVKMHPIVKNQKTEHINLNTITGYFKIKPPLIKKSKLTSRENGGIGKDLSEGWALNFIIGCTHGCIFCYVDSLIKMSGSRYGTEEVKKRWGSYLLIPENIDEAIEETPWELWKGKEVLLSSTHDPYLPSIYKITRKILERALSHGVRFCIQTRSPLVLRDFDLFESYRNQVRVQISIATLNREFSRLIEPNVAPPEGRLEIIKRAKELGIHTGVIVAPVFPPIKVRPHPFKDIKDILERLAEIKPDIVYGECLHIRGVNKKYIKEVLGESAYYSVTFDKDMKTYFEAKLKEYGLRGVWWLEHKKHKSVKPINEYI